MIKLEKPSNADPFYLIVLAGGFGTRLKAISKSIPKSLIPIHGHVFLDIVLAQALKSRPDRIILCLHYNVEAFNNYLHNRNFAVDVSTLVEDIPLGTGGAIKNAFDHFPEMKIAAVINSDTLSKLNLREMLDSFYKYQATAMMGLSKVDDRSRYGSVSVNGNMVSSFSEKNISAEGWINNGNYILSRKIFEGMKRQFSIEDDLFKKLVKSSRLMGYKVHDDDFFDIGTPIDYIRFTREFKGYYYDIKIK